MKLLHRVLRNTVTKLFVLLPHRMLDRVLKAILLVSTVYLPMAILIEYPGQQVELLYPVETLLGVTPRFFVHIAVQFTTPLHLLLAVLAVLTIFRANLPQLSARTHLKERAETSYCVNTVTKLFVLILHLTPLLVVKAIFLAHTVHLPMVISLEYPGH